MPQNPVSSWSIATAAAAGLALIGTALFTVPAAAAPDPNESRIQTAATAAPETFTFTAALRYDRRELRRIAQLVSTPGRGQYRAFRTLAEASAEVGVTRTQRRALRSVARTLGLDVQFSATGLTANLTGPTEVWNDLYGTTPTALPATPWTAFVYVDAGGNLLTTPPELQDVVRGVVPSQSILDSVLDPTLTPRQHPDPVRVSADDTADPPTNQGTPFGPGFDCILPAASTITYSPAQLQVPYGTTALHDAGLRGAGARIVNLAGSYAFSQDYADHAADCFAYDAPTIRFTGGPDVGPQPVSTSGDDEGNLDVQTIAAVIPEAGGFDFLQVSKNAVLYLSFIQAVDTMVSTLSPLPDIATMSFGACEPNLANNPLRAVSEDHFAFAGILGVSMLAASGDGGSSDCSQFVPDPPLATRLNAVQYPASSQWVTGVGGTRITLGEGNERVSEVVWNDSPWGPIDGGTGGPSLYQRPWYQKSITTRDRRLVPDIAAHASTYPGWPLATGFEGELTVVPVAGTSAASPFSAANLALIAAAERSAGNGPLGFLNPMLYQLATKRSTYDTVFYDITSGTNQLYIEAGCCVATPGYDMTTGLGAVNFDRLIEVIPPPGPRALRR